MNKYKVYLASGWFTSNTREILNELESFLSRSEKIDLYSPRKDGVMLPPDQKHDTALRESIFKENISHIIDSDFVVANIDSRDSYNDPGTIYEVGYAMSNNVPVVGVYLDPANIDERFKGILDGFDALCYGYYELYDYIQNLPSIASEESFQSKVLFVGTGNREVDNKIASYIIDEGFSIRWVNECHSQVYSRIDEIFQDIDYMIAIVDDRKTLVSWMIGQAYARGIPVITYSDYNYGINVMLLVSVLTHIRGVEELKNFLKQVRDSGLASIPKFDISQLESM